jgi:DNA-binding PadR family transcriptional regulator
MKGASKSCSVNCDGLYPALYRLEHQGLIDSEWGTSDNNRKAKYYRLTAAGRRRLGQETASWNRLADAIALALSATPQEVR